MHIKTQRLELREFEQADLHRPFEVGPGVEGRPIAPFDCRRPDRLRAQIKAALEAASEVPRINFDHAVITLADGKLIGRAGWQLNPEAPGDAMVWFLSDPASWNQGYASEGGRAIVDHCLRTMHRIWAECDPKNPGAVQLLEGLGMRKEAHFVENAFFNGAWHDSAIYAQLQREWRAAKGLP